MNGGAFGRENPNGPAIPGRDFDPGAPWKAWKPRFDAYCVGLHRVNWVRDRVAKCMEVVDDGDGTGVAA